MRSHTRARNIVIRLMTMQCDFKQGMVESSGGLAERYGVTRHTMSRDLNTLQELHFPIYYEREGRKHMWRYMA